MKTPATLQMKCPKHGKYVSIICEFPQMVESIKKSQSSKSISVPDRQNDVCVRLYQHACIQCRCEGFCAATGTCQMFLVCASHTVLMVSKIFVVHKMAVVPNVLIVAHRA